MAGARTSHAKAACCASRRRAREPGSRWARSRRRPRRGSRRPLRPAYPRAVGRHRAREARGCQPRPRRPGGRKRGARARLRSSLSLTLCTCLVEHREVLPRLHAATARDDDARRAEVGPVRFRNVLRDKLGKPRVGRRGHGRPAASTGAPAPVSSAFSKADGRTVTILSASVAFTVVSALPAYLKQGSASARAGVCVCVKRERRARRRGRRRGRFATASHIFARRAHERLRVLDLDHVGHGRRVEQRGRARERVLPEVGRGGDHVREGAPALGRALDRRADDSGDAFGDGLGARGRVHADDARDAGGVRGGLRRGRAALARDEHCDLAGQLRRRGDGRVRVRPQRALRVLGDDQRRHRTRRASDGRTKR